MPDRPYLIIGYGNPSRGDDAIGPQCLERLADRRDSGSVPDCFETLTDFQLQIEHAMDLHGYQCVIFVDAAVNLTDACQFEHLEPARDNSFSTHALTPSAVLAVYRDFYGTEPPASFLLSVRGESFELGEPLSQAAESGLELALEILTGHLMQGIQAEVKAE